MRPPLTQQGRAHHRNRRQKHLLLAPKAYCNRRTAAPPQAPLPLCLNRVLRQMAVKFVLVPQNLVLMYCQWRPNADVNSPQHSACGVGERPDAPTLVGQCSRARAQSPLCFYTGGHATPPSPHQYEGRPLGAAGMRATAMAGSQRAPTSPPQPAAKWAGGRERGRCHIRRYVRLPHRRRKAVDHHPHVEGKGVVQPLRHGRRVHGNGGDRCQHGGGRGGACRRASGARGGGVPAPTRWRTARVPPAPTDGGGGGGTDSSKSHGDPESTGRAKRIDMAHHLVRERVAMGEVDFHYTPGRELVADGLTKPLPGPTFTDFRKRLGMVGPVTAGTVRPSAE